MDKPNPFEYYDGRLGVKLCFLITGKHRHQDSLNLIAYRTLRYRIKSANSAIRELRRACLNSEALVQFSTLPRDWKDSLTVAFGKPQEEIKRTWFAKHYITDGEARNYYLAHRYGKKEDKKLGTRLVNIYTYNASVIQTVIEVKANRKAYAQALGKSNIRIWDSLSRDVNAFDEVPHDLPNTADGLRYKANKYLQAQIDGQRAAYRSLISGKLLNKNASKTDDHPVQKKLLDELISKHTNLDNELIANLYNVVAQKIQWKDIDAQTVANRKQKKNLVTYAGRKGTKELKHNILMQAKRKRPSAPMLYWTLDGWDVELLYQDTKVNKKGHRLTTYHNRLTVVVILDPHNNYPVGFAIGKNESPDLIRTALKNAMNHVSDLFGDRYRPYQIQSDNYGKKTLAPTYEILTPHYTPAEVGNAKSKVIEPYFAEINKKYCKLMNNWSGFNVSSGSKSQPNSQYLDKIKKSFPDRKGCEKQIISIIQQERAKKQKDYRKNWQLTQPECKTILSDEGYLLALGETSGNTNKLRGDGIRIRIAGENRHYDSFDINFRHQAHQDWQIFYDDHNLDRVLAVSKDGGERFLLDEKYEQPMALADRQPGDAEKLQQIYDFNKETKQMILEERANNADTLQTFFSEEKELDDTLAKHLLTDSIGQHKNNKSENRLRASAAAGRLASKQKRKENKRTTKAYADEEAEYYEEKININEYI